MTAPNWPKDFGEKYRYLQAVNANLTAENQQLRRWKETADEVVREEYIRRDAFPVEEIRRAYKNRVAFDKHNDLLRRVLSLLEQEEGE